MDQVRGINKLLARMTDVDTRRFLRLSLALMRSICEIEQPAIRDGILRHPCRAETRDRALGWPQDMVDGDM
jgi:hypothetical protein